MQLRVLTLPVLVAGLAVPAAAQDFTQLAMTLRGAKLFAQDDTRTFLGSFESAYASNSIYNQFGPHGGQFSANSIFNEYGRFGGRYSPLSPFNSYSTTPPVIVKNGRVIGFLSANKYLGQPTVNPGVLKAMEDMF